MPTSSNAPRADRSVSSGAIDPSGSNDRTNRAVDSVLSVSEGVRSSLSRIHSLIAERTAELNGLLRGLSLPGRERDILDSLLAVVNLPVNDENRFAAYMRLSAMKEDGIRNVLESEGAEKRRKDVVLGNALVCTEGHHMRLHQDLIRHVEGMSDFPPFYRGLMQSVHAVGQAFNRFHHAWSRHILEEINPELESLFDGDTSAIMRFLEESDLLDRGHGGEVADRSYSVLVRSGVDASGIPSYRVLPYALAFTHEVAEIVRELRSSISRLSGLDGVESDQKEAYLRYFAALIEAFSEPDRHRLVEKWAEVDVAWMSITSPFQIGHPLEYYEDHYRKAVAPEWDLRIQNPDLFDSRIQSDVESMFRSLASERGMGEGDPVFDFSIGSLQRTQLYISSPGLYYASFFTGLPSAQVVPNDAIVSKRHGKKIFSFAENILKQVRSRPQMKLASLTLDETLRKKRKEILFGDDAKYYRLYDIETIGHEFGHTLWLDTDTESRMNASGEFKNIEEWKATTGGLMAFFHRPDREIAEDIVVDLISRSVGLIGWMKVEDVQPYYAEGLIHLHILFETDIMRIDEKGRARLNFTDGSFERLSQAYSRHYGELVTTYLEKRDASEFLSRYAQRDGKTLLPVHPNVRAFVLHYHALYEQFGNVVASESEKV